MSVRLSESENTLRLQFSALKTRDDVAKLLDITPRDLRFYLFRAKSYRRFEIAKRSGGTRTISAPANALKIIQRKLNQVLQAVYGLRSPVHGFIRKRSIRTNAARHLGAKWLVNFDLGDFFPSIYFARVKGLFEHKPYNLPREVANTLAQICCHENVLPAGAPTSPIVANMICARMDRELRDFAKRVNFVYTRYADDITFSTRKAELDDAVAYRDPATKAWVMGQEIREIVGANRFTINRTKTRVRDKSGRQEVTGLGINKGLNVSRSLIREVRSMLHAWERYGEAPAEAEFQLRCDRKQRAKAPASFKAVLRGKIEFIGFVRGRTDALYLKLLTRFLSRDERFKAKPVLVDERTHREVISRAVWLLVSETNDIAGTAFAIEGGTLLTAEHCVKTEMFAMQPQYDRELYRVKVIRKDANIDVAEISIEARLVVQFRLGNDLQLASGSGITLVGFPRYRDGDTVAIRAGSITQGRNYQGVPHFVIDADIVHGNSGGPVLDARNNVVGIAVRGVEVPGRFGQNDELSSFVPISLLRDIERSMNAQERG